MAASCASLAQAQTQTRIDIEVLHTQLTLREGETTVLSLFRAPSALTSPTTVTLEVEGGGERFLRVNPARLAFSEAGEIMTSITAIDNGEVIDIGPIAIMISLRGDNVRLRPMVESVEVTIEDDDVYDIRFAREEITLEEGMSETVQLSITPDPSGDSTVAVALSVSDEGQLTVEPERVIFSATSTGSDITVTVKDDEVAEPERTYTVSLMPPEEVPATTGALSVIAPADDDTPTVRVFTERTVLPEGSSASVFIGADLSRELSVSLSVSGLMGDQGDVSLSTSSLTLSPSSPSASFSISVEDNGRPQAGDRAFNVDLDTEHIPRPELPPLAFTIPPNDLMAYASTRAEFGLESQKATQSVTIDIEPPLRNDKSFLVFPEDPRLMVNTGLIARSRSPFPVELALSAGVILGKEERLSLSIIHLDSWQPFAQATAQDQLGTGDIHSCGIKADGRAACWGSDAANRTSPMSSPQGVDVNTRFLSVSAGTDHSCGIKADSRVACWGGNDSGQIDLKSGPQDGINANTRFLAVSAGIDYTCGIKADGAVACWGSAAANRTNPMSSPQGVDANTRFLALSAGGFFHSCGIKADSTVACWGFDTNDQISPTSSPQGVDANTRFLAVSAGQLHNCGIKADSTVACWGFNDNGQTDPTRSPQDVDANTRFLAVSAGSFHSCGIKADGTAACWGDNFSDKSSPTSSAQGVDANTRFLAVSVGPDSHSCGIKADGRAACWGLNNGGQSTPASGIFNQAPDLFRLAEITTALTTRDGGQPVQLNEVTGEIEVLRSRLRLGEGESVSLTLLRALSPLASPVTVTLAIGGSGGRSLSVAPDRFTIGEEGETATATVTANDNDVFADLDPIVIMLSVAGDAIRLTPTETVTVSIENDDVYAIGFDRQAITVKEGMSETVRLSIAPDPPGADTVTVALSVSDRGQLSVKPEKVTFSAASTSLDVVVSVTEDPIPELTKTFTVRLSPPRGIAARAGAMSVTAPADDDAPIVQVMVERPVIPEGMAALVSLDAILNRDLTINMNVSGLTGSQGDVVLSAPSLTLSAAEPSASFSVSVKDNEQPQAGDRTFNVGFSTEFTPQPDLPPLTFTVPPNDLAAHAAERAEFKIREPERTLTIDIEPELQGSKSFMVLSEDPRLTVRTGLITRSQSSFPIDLALSEGVVLGREERLSLSIVHLDSWPPFAQATAQAQLSAGDFHACGIKADNTAACWGFNDNGQTDPTRSPQGVDADTSFLALSAGTAHTCGIKADGAAVCWGNNGSGRSDPASAAGIDANTRFLSVGAGDAHACGIKTDSGAVCWGNNGSDRANPASAAGVDADTRFLALSAGDFHTCGIKADGAMVCWGFNGNERANPASAAGVDADTRFLAVAAGDAHACGIKADGRMVCWGDNRSNRANPASAADANTRFLAVSAGTEHSCGIRADGGMACWGNNGSDRANPANAAGVDADTSFLAVSVGDAHSCGIKADGGAACWGLNNDGQASPPSYSFSRTPDAFRLAESATPLTTPDGGEPAQLNEVEEIEVLRPRLTIREGTTAALTLFRALSSLTAPATVTLTVGEADKEFLSVSPAQIAIRERGGTAAASIAAADDDDIAAIDPINIMLSVTGANTRLTPTETVTVSVENNELYAIGFDRESITLREGMSANVRLSIAPTPPGADTVTVALSVSDGGQLAVEPEELVFSAASTALDVVVAVTEDPIPETKDTFTVSIIPQGGIPARTSPLSVIVPADRDVIVRARVERELIPEGAAASVFLDAVLNQELTIDMIAASGLTGTRTDVILSRSSLTLSPSDPSASFVVSVRDNEQPQAGDRIFNVDLSTMFTPRPELPSLTFIIPPNDLMAYASARAEFTLENERATQSMTIDIEPPLQNNKTFLVFSEDPRLMVNTGFIAAARSPFPVELALSEDTIRGKEGRLSLSISHLDSWQPFAQATAQAQISAGDLHTCGIKADGAAACWGFDAATTCSTRQVAPQGVAANTRFLALSFGIFHVCGIKADGSGGLLGG